MVVLPVPGGAKRLMTFKGCPFWRAPRSRRREVGQARWGQGRAQLQQALQQKLRPEQVPGQVPQPAPPPGRGHPLASPKQTRCRCCAPPAPRSGALAPRDSEPPPSAGSRFGVKWPRSPKAPRRPRLAGIAGLADQIEFHARPRWRAAPGCRAIRSVRMRGPVRCAGPRWVLLALRLRSPMWPSPRHPGGWAFGLKRPAAARGPLRAARQAVRWPAHTAGSALRHARRSRKAARRAGLAKYRAGSLLSPSLV